MPAKSLLRAPEKGAYSHVYNKGAENRIIFEDKEDYDVFLAYLGEYLSAPNDPNSLKRDFTVKGRTYKGTPHLPKNYHGKLELLSFSLLPNHFHLLLHQVEEKAIESFIRSLCTRYSIYFNKKYKHSGALFEGPYKSAKVETPTQLLHLTAHIQNAAPVSSYAEYSGEKATSWVNTKLILSALNEEGSRSFSSFQKEHQSEVHNNKLLAGLVLESQPHVLAKTDHKTVLTSTPRKPEVLDAEIVRVSRMPEYVSLVVLFFLLLGLGYTNVQTSSAQDTEQVVQVLAVTATAIPSPLPEEPVSLEVDEVNPVSAPQVVINTANGTASINIRKAPAIQSDKIGDAKAGDMFELVSIHPGWFEVKLPEGTGFISAKYAYLQ